MILYINLKDIVFKLNPSLISIDHGDSVIYVTNNNQIL